MQQSMQKMYRKHLKECKMCKENVHISKMLTVSLKNVLHLTWKTLAIS